MWNKGTFCLFKFYLAAIVLMIDSVVDSQYDNINPFTHRNTVNAAANSNIDTEAGQRLTALEAKMDLIFADRVNSNKAVDMVADVMKLIIEIQKQNNELTTALHVLENKVESNKNVQEEMLTDVNQTILNQQHKFTAALHVLENDVKSDNTAQAKMLIIVNQTISDNLHNLTAALHKLENKVESDNAAQEEMLTDVNQTILNQQHNFTAALHVLENKVKSDVAAQAKMLIIVNQTISDSLHNLTDALHKLENKVESDKHVQDEMLTDVNQTIFDELHNLTSTLHGLENNVKSNKHVQDERLSNVNQTILNQQHNFMAALHVLEYVKFDIAVQKKMVAIVNQTILNQKRDLTSIVLDHITDTKNLNDKINMINTTLQNRLSNDFDHVAFSACLSHDITNSRTNLKIIFDKIITNIGNGYNSDMGIFTVPSDGLYVFHWTIVSRPGTVYNTDLAVNGVSKRGNAADSGRGGKSWESGSSMVTLPLNRNDQVWIRRWSGDAVFGHDWAGFSGFRLA